MTIGPNTVNAARYVLILAFGLAVAWNVYAAALCAYAWARPRNLQEAMARDACFTQAASRIFYALLWLAAFLVVLP